MSAKSHAFSEYLLDQLGYINSEVDEAYLYNLFGVDYRIDTLLSEYEVRKENAWERKKVDYVYLTATDISSYIFCPVAFTIGFVAWPPSGLTLLNKKAPEWRTLRSPNLQSCHLMARCYAKATLFYPSRQPTPKNPETTAKT